MAEIVRVENDIHLSVPEHQILLSFTNDEDAVAWDGWWSNEGEQMFLQNIEDYRD